MGLKRNLLEDSLEAIDVRPLIALPADATVRQAVEAMRRERLGCVVVLDRAGKLEGAFTERSLIELLLERPEDIEAPLRDHLRQDLICLCRSESVGRLLEIMRDQEVRFVCVEDAAGRPWGLTGQKGLIEYIVDHFPRQIKVQVMEGKPYMDQREGA